MALLECPTARQNALKIDADSEIKWTPGDADVI
jgi:hypothetical protein